MGVLGVSSDPSASIRRSAKEGGELVDRRCVLADRLSRIEAPGTRLIVNLELCEAQCPPGQVLR